jgi:hypothetical protein
MKKLKFDRIHQVQSRVENGIKNFMLNNERKDIKNKETDGKAILILNQ